MRRGGICRLMLLAAAVLGAGCSSNKGLIEGTKWKSKATTIKGQPIPAGILELEFHSDGKLVYQAGPQLMTGTYTLGAMNTVVFNFDRELSGMKQHAEKISIQGDTLTMTDSDGTQISFSKSG